MAKRTREELLEAVRAVIGDSTEDAALALLEDISDSWDNSGDEWKTKYEELDRAWRKKYVDRFFGKEDGEAVEVVDEVEEVQEKRTYDDLFEKEGE